MNPAGQPAGPAAKSSEGPAIWIVTADREIRRRWEPALAAAGWSAVFLESVSALTGVAEAGAVAALALIDADQLAREGDKSLAGAKRGRVRFVVFGRRERHTDEAVIRWLDAGADDFFDAAADPALLVAKLRAHLRRTPSSAASEAALLSPKKLLKADPSARLAWRRAGGAWDEVKLTTTEFALLELFLRHPGKVIERAVILERVWGGAGADVNPETVDKHVESLRRKLGDAGAGLQTVYGSGYSLKE